MDNAPDLFVNEAAKHVGQDGKWTWATFGTSNIEWCAAFVSAVAKTVGILGKCIYNTASASGHAREGERAGMGTFNLGPGQKGNYRPVKGDLILFLWTGKYGSNKYAASHVGIVYEVSGDQVITIEGNTGTNNKYTSTVKQKSYSLSNSKIAGYFHPKWSAVGSADPSSTTSSGYTSGELYATETTRRDMTLREIGYLDANYQPSISASNMRLSAINYTSALAAIFRALAPASSGSVNTDKLEGNCKIVVDYFIGKGLSAGAACGIAGNIFYESNFNAASVGDNGTSFGICQWHNERGAAMKRYVGSDWANNLTGQLDYLWIELNGAYKSSTLGPLRSVGNSEAGARNAADIFVRKFEVPANVDAQSQLRQQKAAEYFSQIVILSPVGSQDSLVLRTQSGAVANVVKTVEVPSSVAQTGMIRNYTNYTYFYPKWSSSSTQRKIADIWNSKGRTNDGNIATIDGYYLVAMAPVFATTGEIVTIELEGGITFHGILADAKGSDATSPWGHKLNGKVDIIEWEAIGNGQKGNTRINLGSWEGKKVIRVHNRGTYLR